MRTKQHTDLETTQRQPAARRDRSQAKEEARPSAADPSRSGPALMQSAVDSSPRVQTQRRAVDALFGPVSQRQAAEGQEGVPLQARRAPATAADLPASLEAGIQALSGIDVSNVRVHRNSDKPAQLNALAYAQGNDIHLGPGQEQHLPHEAWHVVQQRQGRVKETVQMAGVGVNDDVSLEREADQMGARAALQGAGLATRHATQQEDATPLPRHADTARLKGPVSADQAGWMAAEVLGAAHGSRSPAQRASRASRPAHPVSQADAPIQQKTGPLDSAPSSKDVKKFISEAETTQFDMRGHAVGRHGGKVTDDDKMTRRRIAIDSSFDSNQLLERTVTKALTDEQGRINQWLQSKSEDNLVLIIDMTDELKANETQLGSGMRRFDAMAPRQKIEGLTSAAVIFRKVAVPDAKKPHQRARDTEWHLLTAYPIE